MDIPYCIYACVNLNKPFINYSWIKIRLEAEQCAKTLNLCPSPSDTL